MFAAAGLCVLLCVHVSRGQPGSDEDIFRYVGYAWFSGHDLPYRDAFENKPPGVFLTWGLVWWAAHGSAVVGRLLGLAATCATALLIARIARRIWSSREGYIAAALFLIAICSPQFDLPFADTETLGLLFSAAALAVALVWQRDVLQRAAVAGLLCGVALAFKPVFVVDLAAITALLICDPSSRGRRVLVASCAAVLASVPLAACGLYFLHLGAGHDFAAVVFGALVQKGTLHRAEGVTFLSNGLGVFRTLTAPALMGLLILAAGATAESLSQVGKRAFPIVAWVWSASALALIVAQGWGWGHQFKVLVLPLALLAGGAFTANEEDVTDERPMRQPGALARWAALIPAFLAVPLLVRAALLPPMQVWAPSHPAAETTGPTAVPVPRFASAREAIVALTAPTDRIWCYPRTDLYTDSGRLSATRHFTPIFLSLPSVQREVLTALKSGRARLVAINWGRVEQGDIDATFAAADRPAFHAALREVLARDFRHVADAGEWTLYAPMPPY